MGEELRQHRIAWIPWVLALVALLGINAVCRKDSHSHFHDAFDGIGLSLDANDLEMEGRVANPLVLGPPIPLIKTAFCAPDAKFQTLEVGEDVEASTMRHGVARGRAPPALGLS